MTGARRPTRHDARRESRKVKVDGGILQQLKEDAMAWREAQMVREYMEAVGKRASNGTAGDEDVRS